MSELTPQSSSNGEGPEEQKEARRKENWMVTLMRYSEIGFVIPMSVVVGYFLGLLADHLLHTHWLYLAGIIFGAVAGFVSMIRQALESGKAAEAAQAEDAAKSAAKEAAEREAAQAETPGADDRDDSQADDFNDRP
jgi:F0F1-type ATP synthase assembly protein I